MIRRMLLALCTICPALACGPEDEPKPVYVAADTPFDTEAGRFTVELAPPDGGKWPELLGPTDFAVSISPGPDPLPPPKPPITGDGAVPPLVLDIAAGYRSDGIGGPKTITSRVTPVNPDGWKWTTTLAFPEAGDWVVPITITDAAGRSDELELVFHVE